MDDKLKKYLLGMLPRTETAKIDIRLISDPDFENEILQAENDLMEDFLDGLLTPPELENFSKNFLISEERRDELQSLAMIRNYSRKKAAEDVSSAAEEAAPVGVFEKISRFFALNLRPAVISLAVIIVAVVIGFYFWGANNRELAELNRKDLSNLTEFRHLTNLNLIQGTYRDAAQHNLTAKLNEGQLTEQVLLRLAVPSESESFKVKILRNEELIATLEGIRPYSNQKGQELRVLLPSGSLTRGEYKVQAFPKNSEIPIVFTFTIQ